MSYVRCKNETFLQDLYGLTVIISPSLKVILDEAIEFLI